MVEIVEWTGFNVVLSLVPTPLVWLGAWLARLDKRLLLILRDGQLCFFSATLAAVAVHDVHKATSRALGGGASTNLVVAFLIGLIMFSTFVYGVAILLVDKSAAASDDHRVAWISIITAIVTIFAVLGIRWNLELLG